MGIENGMMKFYLAVVVGSFAVSGFALVPRSAADGCNSVRITGAKMLGMPVDDWSVKRKAAVERVRPVVYNTDGCEMYYWPSNLPVSVENFTSRRLKYAIGTRATTIAYCPQSAGFGMFTCRKAGEPLFAGGKPGHYNALREFIKLDTDALQMASEFCASNNFELFVSIRVNDQHDCCSKIGQLSPHYPKFKVEHPECLMGSIDRESPRRRELFPGYAGWSCVNFAEPLVRDHMKKFVRELVENYEVGGIEYDFNRHFMLFRSVAVGGVATHEEIATMTQFMRELKAITEEVGRRKGRPIVIAMRSPDSVPYNLAVGVDLETWFREKLVDIWIGGGYFLMNPLEDSVRVAHRHGIKFFWSLDETRIPSQAKKKKNPIIPGRMSDAFYAARYSAAKAAGCDGVYLFNTENEKLRKVASVRSEDLPDLPKLYFALERGSGGYSPNRWVKNGMRFSNLVQIDPNVPLALNANAPCEFQIFFGDDFSRPTVARALIMTNLRDGELNLTVNGQSFTAKISEKGMAVVKLPAGLLRPGNNQFSVSSAKKLKFHDFAVEIRRALLSPRAW